MDLAVRAALRRGFERTVEPNGLLFILLLTVINTVFVGIPAGFLPATGGTVATFAVTVATGIGFILSLLVLVAAIRTFASPETDTVPREYVRRRIGSVMVNMILGSVIVTIVVGLGFILIIPGLYLLVTLLYWHMYVAVEDQDFIDALRMSWGLTEGHKWQTLALVAGIFAVVLVLNTAAALFAGIIPVIPLQSVIIGLFTAFGTVFGVAAVADAYNQLRADRAVQQPP